eukprot:3343206-Pleurochrysis_carterae.AAC.1
MAAVRAAGRVQELLLATQSDTSDWQLCFLWCRLPQVMETIIYMGLRAIFRWGIEVVVYATPCRTSS